MAEDFYEAEIHSEIRRFFYCTFNLQHIPKLLLNLNLTLFTCTVQCLGRGRRTITINVEKYINNLILLIYLLKKIMYVFLCVLPK